MMSRTRAVLTGGVCVLSLVGTACGLLATPTVELAAFSLPIVAFAAAGCLLALRRPENAVGWLLLAFGALGGLGGALSAWLHVATAAGLPGAALSRWTGTVLWVPVVGLATGPLLVLFPDGHLPSRRWRVVLWLSGAFAVLAVVGNGLYPWAPGEGGPNPYGLQGAERTLRAVQDLAGVALLLSLAGGVAALAVRYRRGSDLQRRQLRWFLAAAAFLPPALIAGEAWDQALRPAILPSALLLLVGAITVAVLRYHLYDIDRIVSRTLSYALVSGALVTLYAGAVVALNTLLPLAEDSPLTVAAATLAAAAAFNPLRRRVQAGVDRRFNRAHYDAARTVEAFGARLREATDLDALTADLLAAVANSVQPARAGVWLPAGGRTPHAGTQAVTLPERPAATTRLP